MAKITGRDALLRKMAKLPSAVRSAIKQALAEGADQITEAQKRAAPVKSGKLRDSIVQTWGGMGGPKHASLKVSEGAGDPDLTVTISAGNSGTRYAHLVEFGTSAHTITSDKPMGKNGIFGTVVHHPGAAPHPFFYPVYRANRRSVKARISRATRKAAQAVAAGGQ